MKFVALFVVVAAIVALSFAGAVPGSLAIGKRQSGCPPPAITTQCALAIQTFNVAFAASVAGTSRPSAMNRDAISDSLDTMCGTGCYGTLLAAFRCVNRETYIASAVCGRSGAGTRCSLALIDRINSDTSVVPPTTCGVTDCTSDCENTLNQIRSDLGCCAASFFNTTGSPFAAVGARYDRCDISLGTVCPSQSGAAAGMIYLSATLLVAISAIAASIL